MEKLEFKCIEFFNRYIIEEIVYKDDGENIVPVKVLSRSTLGSKFKNDDVISINRPSFNENLKYVREKEEKIIDDDIFKWLDVRINNSLATSLLDEWSTKDINEFAQVIKSFLLERRIM
ncbi:hypothetical protein [Brachyspira hampsonii]|uniref:hypothetical protein n=1 Tax=Brachyspira hampsonii TaxID=1287055 RepID=UPI000D334FCF|nr:hypothetical protein [Brachyspira hampsonii]PTY39243.1 hypothetical protein DQ06_00990 [Brachyspira hampsonii bv. II]